MNRKRSLFLLQVGNFSVRSVASVFNIGSMFAGIVDTDRTAIERLILNDMAMCSRQRSAMPTGMRSGGDTMSDFEEVIDQLWLHATFEEDFRPRSQKGDACRDRLFP